MALECAMDELAEKLNLDPIELRIRNEPSEDPEKHIPYSSRHLIACMQEGARRFGWDKRNPKPGQVRDGRWLVGMGMAAATRGNPLRLSKANVRLDPDGIATVRMAMTDIGTGTYTILAQIAAEMLGLPIGTASGSNSAIPTFPEAAGSGGSLGAGSSGSALFEACNALREKLARTAGMDPATARFADGSIASGEQSRKLTDLVGAGMDADGEIQPGRNNKDFSQQSYGAHFAEVGVDEDTGEVRLRRMLGVFAAGRVLNAKTARSQAIGGMVFGVGAALQEEMTLDPALRLFRQSRSRRIPRAGARRYSGHRRHFSCRAGRQIQSAEEQGHRRTRDLRRRRRDRQCGLQRVRRPDTGLPDHARQAAFQPPSPGVRFNGPEQQCPSRVGRDSPKRCARGRGPLVGEETTLNEQTSQIEPALSNKNKFRLSRAASPAVLRLLSLDSKTLFSGGPKAVVLNLKSSRPHAPCSQRGGPAADGQTGATPRLYGGEAMCRI